jgi:hypothetical protein
MIGIPNRLLKELKPDYYKMYHLHQSVIIALCPIFFGGGPLEMTRYIRVKGRGKTCKPAVIPTRSEESPFFFRKTSVIGTRSEESQPTNDRFTFIIEFYLSLTAMPFGAINQRFFVDTI